MNNIDDGFQIKVYFNCIAHISTMGYDLILELTYDLGYGISISCFDLEFTFTWNRKDNILDTFSHEVCYR